SPACPSARRLPERAIRSDESGSTGSYRNSICLGRECRWRPSVDATTVLGKVQRCFRLQEMPVFKIDPFHIAISDDALADLRRRLDVTRWPHVIADDWSRG